MCRLDVTMYFVYVVSFALKFFESTLSSSKALFALNTFIIFLRLLRWYAKHPTLGPKILMIERMTSDMGTFGVVEDKN